MLLIHMNKIYLLFVYKKIKLIADERDNMEENQIKNFFKRGGGL